MFNFEKLNSRLETSKFISREEVVNYHVPPAAVGDFLSRLWSLFGDPNGIDYEGFSYDIKHIQTNTTFSAYCAGSGPSYGHLSDSDDEKLLTIIKELETELQKTKPVDCEIQYETDFGLIACGSKDGVPYENVIRPKE